MSLLQTTFGLRQLRKGGMLFELGVVILINWSDGGLHNVDVIFPGSGTDRLLLGVRLHTSVHGGRWLELGAAQRASRSSCKKQVE